MGQDVITLLVLFQLKHLLADYFLQNRYMLGKFKRKGWVLPLLCHCYIHAAFTTLISVQYVGVDLPHAFGLGGVDIFAHFIMDRIKASPDLLGRFKPDQARYWWILGVDQMVHHLTHYLIIYLLLSGGS